MYRHDPQGSRSIMFATVRPEPEHAKEIDDDQPYGRASYNALNVAVTRAQFGTHIFTNSVEGLARSVESVDVKTSTLKYPSGPAEKVARALPGGGVAMAKPSGELGDKIRNLERLVRGPGEKVHRLNLENIRVPALSSPVHEPQKPVREIPVVQKETGRQLELSLPKKFEMELEK